MKTQLIPKEDWAVFCDGFSRRHKGWFTILEVLGPEVGAQTEERALPLEGIAVELKGDGEIEIMVGGRTEVHITYTITSPTEVTLEQTDEGADAALAIKSRDGTTTLLRLPTTALPEMVDDV